MEELRRSLVMRSPAEKRKKTKEQVQACWEETLQKLLTTQELANSLVHDGGFSAESLSLFSVEPVVLQTLEQLGSRQQEVDRLLSQVHQQLEHCERFQERLVKVLYFCGSGLVLDILNLLNPLNRVHVQSRQDLQTVDQLLSSCTMMDLGSELQTSRLMQRFEQARPHFMVRPSRLFVWFEGGGSSTDGPLALDCWATKQWG